MTPDRQKPLPSSPTTSSGLSPNSRQLQDRSQHHDISQLPSQRAGRDGTAGEVIMGGATDVESTRYDVGRQGSIKKLITGLTGQAGDSGLPPSRPSSIASAVSSKLDGRSQLASRKGLLPFSSGGLGGSALGAGSFRPQSSASKTHVPSLAAQGFFRPMSSRRLQAQRSQRPNSLLGTNSVRPGTADRDNGETSAYRQSVGSDAAVRGTPLQPSFMRDSDGPLPPSRGSYLTEYELQDRTALPTSPIHAEPVPTHEDAYLAYSKPSQHADFDTALKNVNHLPLPVQKTSAKTFQSSFIVPGSGTNVPAGQQLDGSKELQSGHSTSTMDADKPLRKGDSQRPGKNYEYFTGNTVFCWGGRLQNTRDRPITIATAIGFLMPSILFFIFA